MSYRGGHGRGRGRAWGSSGDFFRQFRGRGGGGGTPQGYQDTQLYDDDNAEAGDDGSTGSLNDSRSSHYDSCGMAKWSTEKAEVNVFFNLMERLNGGGYGQLKSLTGRCFGLNLSSAVLEKYRRTDRGGNSMIYVTFHHVQSDPFAPGSEVEVSMPIPFDMSPLITFDGNEADQRNERFQAVRRVAAEDFLLRKFKKILFHSDDDGFVDCHSTSNRREGNIDVTRVSPHVLPRSAARIDVFRPPINSFTSWIHFLCRVKLPGHGRRIDGHGIIRIVKDQLLRSMTELWAELSDVAPPSHTENIDTSSAVAAVRSYMDYVHDQEWLRSQLIDSNLSAFVVNGAILPRAAGNSDRPLGTSKRNEDGVVAVPFESPPELLRSFTLPCSGRVVEGMGLPFAGLTLIAGGGFHGKSTLLRSLELGIYNHTPWDGRAFVVTDPSAAKIRAEDRRAVHGVAIDSFITNLPFSKDTSFFITSEASGSTSQASNLMEALELGATTLLVDEDTSATNLMYRDAVMQGLVPSSEEPITSLVERIPMLVKEKRVGVILVVGGSGQYFPHADVVLVMKNYHVRDATQQAKTLGMQYPVVVATETKKSTSHELPFSFHKRHVDPRPTFMSLASTASSRGYGRGGYGHGPAPPRMQLKVSASSANRIRVGLDEEIDLSLVEQLVEEGQLQAIAQCIALCFDKGEKWVDEIQKNFSNDLPAAANSNNNNQAGLSSACPPLLPSSVSISSGSSSQFRLGGVTNYSRLIYACEQHLRASHLELRTPSAYIPRGFSTLPRVMEIGAALNRLRSLRTKCL